MNSYWPSDINMEDTSTPLDVIEEAKQEWRDSSNGLLELIIQESELENKDKALVVHAQHRPSNITITLFSVVHRADALYPVRIQLRDEGLPNQYKKKYYKPGFADMATATGGISGQTITNKWVCDTPSEFRSKLKKLFNLGSLKADILNLLSSAK